MSLIQTWSWVTDKKITTLKNDPLLNWFKTFQWKVKNKKGILLIYLKEKTWFIYSNAYFLNWR